MTGPVATIPPAFEWRSQVGQYPKIGPVGISTFEGWKPDMGLTMPILCLLWRDERGLLRGVLNYYQENSPWERKGNVNIFVDPEWQGRGVGKALLTHAIKRWRVDLTQQKYTRQGAAFVQRLIEKGVVKWPASTKTG